VKKRAIAVFVAGAMVASPPVWAEVVLDSRPGNVHLRLDGPVDVDGNTPMALDVLPPGRYLMRASGPGVADARGRLYSADNGNIRAEPWAGWYALITPPGYMHLIRDDEWRGALLLLSVGGTATMTLVQANARKNAEDDLHAAQDLYRTAVTPEAIALARLAVEQTSQREADERTMRNLWAGYTAALWVGAAAEAWLFTPHPNLFANAGGGYLLDVPHVSGWKTASISAILPGSGQRYAGRGPRGTAFTFAVLGLAAGTLVAYDVFLDARRDQAEAQALYDRADTVDEIAVRARALEDAADHTNNMSSLRWALLGTTAAFWTWNVVDAAGIGASSAKEGRLRLALAPRLDGLRAELTWRLQ
jgi:hypothetical protein